MLHACNQGEADEPAGGDMAWQACISRKHGPIDGARLAHAGKVGVRKGVCMLYNTCSIVPELMLSQETQSAPFVP